MNWISIKTSNGIIKINLERIREITLLSNKVTLVFDKDDGYEFGPRGSGAPFIVEEDVLADIRKQLSNFRI